MVVVDRLSKQAHVIPMTSDVTASGVAQLFRDHIWKLHGLPKEVISDRGTQFVSNFTCNLSQLLGIQVAASMDYHPQTDGQTERVNQEVEQFLQLFVNQCQDDWYDWLAIAKLLTMTEYMPPHNYPPHAGYQTEPLTWYQNDESVMPRDPQQLHLPDGSGNKGSTFSPCPGSQ